MLKEARREYAVLKQIVKYSNSLENLSDAELRIRNNYLCSWNDREGLLRKILSKRKVLQYKHELRNEVNIRQLDELMIHLNRNYRSFHMIGEQVDLVYKTYITRRMLLIKKKEVK